MVGGRVLNVFDHEKSHLLVVEVGERHGNTIDRLCVNAIRDQNTPKIEIGDTAWWCGPLIFWTPQTSPRKKCGIDFDIRIDREGYSYRPAP